MELTRKQVIQRLVMMKSYAIGENYEALDYAISSLKTDEAYQIMYEGGEIFTKADLVAMLTEIQLEIEEMDSGCGWEGYRPTAQVIGLIQQKINELKADQEGEK